MKKYADSKFLTIGVALVVILGVGFIGVYLFKGGNAATAPLSAEPENGTITLPAISITDSTASGGKAVGFKAPVAPPPTTPPPPTSGTTFTIAAAGDIASNRQEKATSDLIYNDSSIHTVLMLGDAAYPDGTTSDFTNKYHPTWGRFKSKTKPTPGNHEYHTSSGAPYYTYFNNVPKWYSFNIGSWHFISLNSNEDRSTSSPQYAWLQKDLADHLGYKCTLAFWHHPRYSGGSHGDNSSVNNFWNPLMAANAELVLAGHSHIYERFAPMNASATVDTTKGLRSFVVGTGGTSLQMDSTTDGKREFYALKNGVMKFILTDTAYSWKFIDITGATLDSGSGTCR